MKRSLIFGLIAVLSAGLLLVACSDGSDSGGTSTVINGRLVDVAVESEANLLAALLNPDYQIIGVIDDISPLTGALVIPKGKTVVLYAEVAAGQDLLFEVQGEVIVDGSGKLIADAGESKWVLVSDGHIVVSNGTLEVDDVAAIYTSVPGSTIKNPAFNTGGIRFENGTLDITEPVDNLGNIETLFKLVPRGDLKLKGVGEDIHPSVLADTIKTTATRRLAIENAVGHIGAGDPVETLTIPAGMTFTTADPLPELISLTVLGKLTATGAKLAQVTDLNVAGELVAASALYTGLTTLTVSGTFATAQALSGLTALTVEGPLGNFSAPSVAGAGTGDDAGITLAVNAGGTATITGVIGNLKLGTIAGTLTTAANFTPLTPSGGTSTASPLSALAGAVINGVPFTAETTEVIALADNAVTTGNFAVSASQALRIPANEGITTPTTLTIAAGSTFTYNGQVTLATTTGTGSLVLASGATGAKIAGTGTITAGATVITGNWEATGTTDGILTILSATTGATITATSGATGLKASAAGAAIVQGTANLNFLVIGVGTTIDLAGTINAKVGEIILTAGTNPGALKLTADDPNGARITANAGTGATQIGGVTTVTIDSKTVTFAQIAKTTFLLETGTQFSSVKAGTSDDATITAHTSGDNASINSTAIAEGAD